MVYVKLQNHLKTTLNTFQLRIDFLFVHLGYIYKPNGDLYEDRTHYLLRDRQAS